MLKAETVELMTQNHIGELDGQCRRHDVATEILTPCDSVSTSPSTSIPRLANLPYGKGTYYWGGAAGTWFWIDPVNDLAFVGMIQNRGGNRPGGLNFRGDSARLVYAALAASTHKPTDR